MQASDAEGNLGVPRLVSLGPTAGLQNLQIISGGGSGVLLLSWVGAPGDGALVTEVVQFFYTATQRTERTEAQTGYVGTGVVRGNDEATVGGLAPGGEYLVGVWVSPIASANPSDDAFSRNSGSEVQWLTGNADA